MRSEQTCLMPALCAKCERLFDAKHDFQEEEDITERGVLGKNKAPLCWECR